MALSKVITVFEQRTRQIAIADIYPLRLISEAQKSSPKFIQVQSSVKEIGLVELPVVARQKDEKDGFILLDGHTRIEVLKQLDHSSVECLIATDDEAFTYNKRISRIATIQEHMMILKAIDRGVPEERIAQALNVDVPQIRLKRRLLNGICEEAVDLLKDKIVPINTFAELKKMKAVRQVEAAQLMIAMNKYSVTYAKSLVAASPQEQLTQHKRVADLTDQQMALMERESISLDREIRLIEGSYGEDNLDVVFARGYLKRILDNARVVRHLAQHFPELLAEFQRILETELSAT